MIPQDPSGTPATPTDVAATLITLGVLLLLGLVTDAVGRHTRLPRVTLLLTFGIVVGPEVLNVLPGPSMEWFPVVASTALVMVGFLLGETLTLAALRRHGRFVLWISIGEVVATASVVGVGLAVTVVPLELALLLAAIATATDPAATTDAVREMRAEGRFTNTLLGVVAVDDAWGLIVFSLLLAIAQALGGQGGAAASLLAGAWEVGGAVLVGVLLGVPMAYLTGRLQPGEPTLAEALGVVFLCGGIALWLEVSFLLASIVLGTVVANLARHHTRPFHAIEGIEWPFMILFFVLAGASLHLGTLSRIGVIGTAYVALRIAGRVLGSWVGAVLCRGDAVLRRFMGLALMPQAGVALGAALVATQRVPSLAETLLPVVVGATVLFELVGPVLTRFALERAGEAAPH